MNSKQITIWKDFYSPLEIGWWIMFALDNIINDPNAIYTIYSKKSKQSICGSIPNNWNGNRYFVAVNDDIFSDGNQLHLN